MATPKIWGFFYLFENEADNVRTNLHSVADNMPEPYWHTHVRTLIAFRIKDELHIVKKYLSIIGLKLFKTLFHILNGIYYCSFIVVNALERVPSVCRHVLFMARPSLCILLALKGGSERLQYRTVASRLTFYQHSNLYHKLITYIEHVLSSTVSIYNIENILNFNLFIVLPP